MSSLNTGVPSSQDTDTVGTDMEFEILCKCMHADKLSHKSITCKAYLQAILASTDLFLVFILIILFPINLTNILVRCKMCTVDVYCALCIKKFKNVCSAVCKPMSKVIMTR